MIFQTELSVEAQLDALAGRRRDHPGALGIVRVRVRVVNWGDVRRGLVGRQLDDATAAGRHLPIDQPEAVSGDSVVVGHELDRESTVGRLEEVVRLEDVGGIAAEATHGRRFVVFAVKDLYSHDEAMEWIEKRNDASDEVIQHWTKSNDTN